MNPACHGLRAKEVTFDARVNSILNFDLPGQLSLEFRIQATFLRANLDAKASGEVAWKKAKKLTPKSIVRVVGHIHLLSNQVNGDKVHTSGDDDVALHHQI